MLDNLRATIGLQFVITMTNNKKDELDNKKNELFKVQGIYF